MFLKFYLFIFALIALEFLMRKLFVKFVRFIGRMIFFILRVFQ
ncbi:unnamed protein product [Haemonchus placei]|uniref:NADH dehydrogenase subunit 1 n=1 Tax=Haemonchus placei TaxID=6290 RepID=A0A0N4X8Z9_HAEPC|nr:unnamed protein product [Haemonchus placei]